MDTFPYWLTMKQVSELTQVSVATLKRKCAAGLIDPVAGRKFGGVWRWKRDVILDRGLIYQNEKRAL